MFTSGHELPLAGLLLALPSLQATGLLSAAEATFGMLKRGACGVRAVSLTLVFLALVREPRAEGLSGIVPSDLGRVPGLDRAPEVGTLRRKLGELAGTSKAGELLQALARHHVRGHPDAPGCLYLDGHVRTCHGQRGVPKTFVARMRISMSALLETWVCDAHGDPVFAVIAEPSASLVEAIERLLPELRQLAGERRITMVFDRGGWSPALFARLVREGFDILTYRKGKTEREGREAFSTHTWVDERGREHTWQLAERTITLPLPGQAAKAFGERALTLRQITRAIDDHHTTILTSGSDLPASGLAHTPTRVPLEKLGCDARVLDRDTKLITHAARITAFKAESALAHALAPHFARAKHEGHDLIREALTSSGDIRATRTSPTSTPLTGGTPCPRRIPSPRGSRLSSSASSMKAQMPSSRSTVRTAAT